MRQTSFQRTPPHLETLGQTTFAAKNLAVEICDGLEIVVGENVEKTRKRTGRV
jgi:hypothetical protein